MRLLIKRAVISDTASSHHKKKVDILIRDGKIEKIGRALNVRADRTIEYPNLHVSQGFCDIGAQAGEPGFEHREDLTSLSKAAIAGGYTTVACFPNTHPAIDSKSGVEYILNRSKSLPIDIYPIGAITTGATGNDIAEMHDMHQSGAVGFSNGRQPISDTGIMLLALQYVKTFNGVVLNRPHDARLSPGGQIHESEVSASLGMKGIPTISEQLMLERDLRLLEYAGSRLHVFGISSRIAVQLIRAAQRRDKQLSASVPALNLLMTDRSLTDFNTNLKVMPPLRTLSDRSALIRGIRDGVISSIVSNHEPYEEELKDLEFARAEFGISGIQTTFSTARTALKDEVELEDMIRCLTDGPRQILNLASNPVSQGNVAELTFFDPDAEWEPDEDRWHSTSENNPFFGKPLTGKVYGVFKDGELHQNDFD